MTTQKPFKIAGALLALALLLPFTAPAATVTLSAPVAVSPAAGAVGGKVWITLQGAHLDTIGAPAVLFRSFTPGESALTPSAQDVSAAALDVVVLSQRPDRMDLQVVVPASTTGTAWNASSIRDEARVSVSGSGSDVIKHVLPAPFRVDSSGDAGLWVLACFLAILAIVTWVSRSIESNPSRSLFGLVGGLALLLLFGTLSYVTYFNESMYSGAYDCCLWVYIVGAVLLAWVVAQDFLRDLLIDFLVGDSGTYSITLYQVFFWTLIVFLSTIYVWLVTGQLIPITTQILALLGITGGTHMASRAMNSAPAAAAPATAVKPRLSDLFTDYVNGRRLADLTKLQMFLWTLLTGVKLLNGALENYQWSDLSTEYLLLIGVSNGIYAGSKYIAYQANQNSPAPAAPSADPVENPDAPGIPRV